jgi:hypothetical protein
MARVTIPPATLSIAGPTTATVLPTAEATSLATFTGFQFVNNGAVLIRVVVGASGVGTLTVNFQRLVEGQLPAAFTIAVANSTTYLIGPYRPSDLADVNSITYIDKSGTVTGDTVGLYFLPGAVV